MTVCPKYEKMLLLDVTGELDDKLLFSWQSHLKKCSACRREREMLSAMMKRLKSASPAPNLSAADADTMVANINRELAINRNAGMRFTEWIRAYGKMIPAAAAACLLFIVLGVFWQENRARQDGPQFGHQAMNHPEAVEVISPDEIEIIKNFELLREFESLEKLVQVIDYTEPNEPLTREPNNSHGSIFNEKNSLYS